MEKEVKYKDWIFEVDFSRTKEIYSNLEFGSPENCKCNECLNFAKNRDKIYPSEIKELFNELGIDYNKESEIYHIVRIENGLHNYGGWFHFKGRIKEGKDCKIKLQNGGSTWESIKISENFEIAFMKDNALNNFSENEKNELIQIEFIANSEWVIDEKLEYIEK